MSNPNTITLQVSQFPDDLRRRVKALAAYDGITLREAILEAAESWCQYKERGAHGGSVTINAGPPA